MAVNFGQFEAHKDDSVRRTVDMLLNAYRTKIEQDRIDLKEEKYEAKQDAAKLQQETGDVYNVKKKTKDYSDDNVDVKFSKFFEKGEDGRVYKKGAFSDNYKAIKDTLANFGRNLKADETYYKAEVAKDEKGNIIPTYQKKQDILNKAAAATGRWDSNNDGVINEEDKLTWQNQMTQTRFENEEEDRKVTNQRQAVEFDLNTKLYHDKNNNKIPDEGDIFSSTVGGTLEGFNNYNKEQENRAADLVSRDKLKKARTPFDKMLEQGDSEFYRTVLTGDGIDLWLKENNLEDLNTEQKRLLKTDAMDKLSSRAQGVLHKYMSAGEGLENMTDEEKNLMSTYYLHKKGETIPADKVPAHLYRNIEAMDNLTEPGTSTVPADEKVADALNEKAGSTANWVTSNATSNGHQLYFRNRGGYDENNNPLINRWIQAVKDITKHPSYKSEDGIGIEALDYGYGGDDENKRMFKVTDFDGYNSTHTMYYDKNENKFMVHLDGKWTKLDDDAIADIIETY